MRIRLPRKAIDPSARSHNTSVVVIEKPVVSSALVSDADVDVAKVYFIPIIKANAELQEVTGVVLQPEETDAQEDIMDEVVIRDAAHDFMWNYNVDTQLGFMHKDFKPRFQLCESWITPMDMVIGNRIVKKGSWVITVKVNDAKVWAMVKDGKITGFSVGGKAKVMKLAA